MPFSMICLMANHKGCPKKNCFTEFEGKVGRLGFWITLGLEVWIIWTKIFGPKIWSCSIALKICFATFFDTLYILSKHIKGQF